MATEKNVRFSFSGLLPTGVFLIFLYLKLAGIAPVAEWSWWAVTCPLWIPLVIVFGIVLIVFVFAAFIGLLSLIFKGK